jgi:hypothetical protein
MNQPYGVHVGSGGRVYVADTGNHRVLVFTPPFSDGMAASAVLGQQNLSTCAANRGGAVGPSTLKSPWRVFEDPSGNVYVADYGNNRVVIYHTPFPTGDLVADEVLGQADLSSGGASGAPGPLTLRNPADVFADAGGSLFVADSENSRVTRYGSASPIVLLDPLMAPPVVGDFLTVTGSGFTAGSVLKVWVAGGSGIQAYGPYVPGTWHPGFLITNLPPTIGLGRGFVTVQVINTDQGYASSNTQAHWLYGSAARDLPTIHAIDGVTLPEPNRSVPMAYVETSLTQGSTVTIDGSGFKSARVNVFTAAGNVGPLVPLPGGTASRIQVVLPASAPTGPGSVQVVNVLANGSLVSNAVSVPIGPRLTIDSVSQSGDLVTVTGTGFSQSSVINLFSRQGAGVANLGGLNPDGSAKIPLAVSDHTGFTFALPAGASDGPAFIQVLNPPFIPYSSSGTDPDGAFTIVR